MHEIDTRYAKNHCITEKSNKTTSGRHFEISGTRLCKKIPFNRPIHLFKKCIFQRLMESADELKHTND